MFCYHPKVILSVICLFVSCICAAKPNNSNLVSVGSYITPGGYLPLLAVSNDQGKTWDYISSHSKLLNGMFSHTSCNNEDLCIAVGPSFDDSNTAPLVAISRDREKKIWSYLSVHPSDFDHSEADTFSVDCNAQFCAIAGTYYNKDKQHLPFIALTKDKGKTWTYPETIKNLPENFKYLRKLGPLSCSDTICVVSGYYATK